nr:hypothetical protein [Tanacetum cinerariifolium]
MRASSSTCKRSTMDEMLRLQGLRFNTPSGVPYTDDEIMVIVRGGKQRGHIPGVGRVFPEGTIIPPSPPCTHSSDAAKLKMSENLSHSRSTVVAVGVAGAGAGTTTRMGRMRTIVRRYWLTENYFDDLPNSSDHPPQHQTHSFESYNDNPNYGYPPQEPFVYNQDPCSEQTIVDNSKSPPQPQYEMYACELCGNDAHYGYDCLPQVPLVYNQDPCFNQDFDNNFSQTSPSFQQQYLCCENCRGPHATFKYINSPSWNGPAFHDDDDDEYSIQVSEKSPIAITPVLPTEEPKNSLSMGDEHLSTILETESDQVIKSSVEDLVPIPSESEGILDHMCDVPFSDKNYFDSEDDSFEAIDYVEESPFDYELASLEEVKDEILRAKLLNIHLLIYKIESLNNNPTHDCVLKSPSSSFFSYSDNSLPELETFSDYTKETSSGSTTTHADNSLPK